jgi:anti-sigma B factor antagonist
MDYKLEKKNNYTIVRFDEKRLDVLVAQDIKTDLFRILEDNIKVLGLDLSNVQFMDSSGLGALVAVLKRITPHGRLLLWGLSPEVKSLFELTQLYKVFDVYELEKDALLS